MFIRDTRVETPMHFRAERLDTGAQVLYWHGKVASNRPGSVFKCAFIPRANCAVLAFVHELCGVEIRDDNSSAVLPPHTVRFTTGGGKSELIRDLQGPQAKRYYQGWVQFMKIAKTLGGEFVLLRDVDDCSIFLNTGGKISSASVGEAYDISGMSAIAAIAKDKSDYKGADVMSTGMFVGKANTVDKAFALNIEGK